MAACETQAQGVLGGLYRGTWGSYYRGMSFIHCNVLFCVMLSSDQYEMQFLDDLAMQALRREDEAREEQCKASPQSEA